MESVVEIIVKYWLEVLLGLIVTGLSLFCKRVWKMYKDEKNHQKTKEQKEFYDGLQKLIKEGAEESRQGDAAIREEIGVIKDGVLSIQRKSFMAQCTDLLKKDHELTLEEYKAIQEEHNIYHNLGGNHDGDNLFELVEEKAKHDIA